MKTMKQAKQVITLGAIAMVILFLGQTVAQAKAAGLNNVEWMWEGLRKAIDQQENSPHKLVVVKTGHVPTVKKPGHSVHNEVDAFIRKAVSSRARYPFNSYR